MKLYGFPLSPNTWQVRALAAHLGMPLELELVDLTKGGSRTPEFLALNPTGRTPVLIDGAFKLWEANAIMQYMASQKANSLWPNDARTRADIMRWQSFTIAHWLADAWIPVLSERFIKKALNLGPIDEARVAKGVAAFAKEAAVLDAHLSKHNYLVDDTLTIADFTVAAPLFYAKQAELPLGQYPQLCAWFDRVSALPCWQQTAPQLAAAA
jgi:glutathione S-transferase